MTQQTNTNTDRMPDWYDPFVEPNTMPRSWDLSEQGYTGRSREALEHDRQAKEANA
jgi:hypothetical protein